MIVQPGLCQTWSEMTLLVFSSEGSYTVLPLSATGIPAKVPGGVHTALMDNGIIADPFYRTNDKLYLWVGRTDWTYYRTFDGITSVFLKDNVMKVLNWLCF